MLILAALAAEATVERTVDREAGIQFDQLPREPRAPRNDCKKLQS